MSLQAPKVLTICPNNFTQPKKYYTYMHNMKSIYKRGALKLAGCMAAFLIMPFVSSCESVYDEQGDCDPHYYLRFVYDMNMLYNTNHQVGSDAFSSQVGSVEVYVFNSESGEYVTCLEESGEALRQAGYLMPLDLAPGSYDLIAWCGLTDNDGHFTLSNGSIKSQEDLKCKMDRRYDTEGKAYNDSQLNPLFHGRLDVELPDKEGEYIYTIYLIKDTNYIELALQHRSGALDPERFTITLTDDNGYLAHDNSLLKDEVVEYRPWIMSGGVVDMELGSRYGESDPEGTGFLVAELATSRLMANHNPVLQIKDNETGKAVFSIPMVEWALMFKSARHADMDDQEYLDREYEYNVMVILENDEEKNEGWIAADIVINGWHKIDNSDTDLGF